MNRVCSLLLIIIVSALTALPCTAQAQEAKTLSDPKELEAFLDSTFAQQMEKLHVPGAAIAVVKDGKIFFIKGYGYSNLERKTAVTPDKTIFRIGSITKVFTATALVQLAERRKIDLSDDVNKYLKEFKIRETYPRPITFANLLTHTAGFDEINVGRKTTSAERVTPLGEFLKTRLIRRRPPGELFSYSTYGISLAGYLVETISGIPFKEYLNKNIFQPLEMSRTTIGSVPGNLQPELATGYAYFAGSYRPVEFEYFNTYPASDINSTVTDMAHFMIAHLDKGRYANARILSERAAQDMHRQHFTNDPRLIGFTYGFFEKRRNGVRAIEHGGSMDGFSSLMYLMPDKGTGIFIACNRETSGLQDRVRDAFLDRYFPAEERPTDAAQSPPQLRERLERFAGKYRMDVYCHTCPVGARGFVPQAFDITANDDGTISFWGGRWRQVEPLLFRLVSGQLDSGEVIVLFREDQNGQIKYMLNGTSVNEKLPPEESRLPVIIDLDPRIYDAYAGTYEVAPNQLITIVREGNKLFGEMPGQPKVELFPTSQTRFIVKAGDAEINFMKDAQGQVTHLFLRLNVEEIRARKIK